MEIKLLNIKVHYEKDGTKGREIILLHGWDQNYKMMEPIAKYFANDFQVYNLDLPGFGESGTLETPWGVFEYMLLLKEFIDHFNISNPIIISHSFGSRIALLYASKYPVYKMVITGGAGLLPKRSKTLQFKIKTYKVFKQILISLKLNSLQKKLATYFGSEDYKKLDGVMRASFNEIVNFDLQPYLNKIAAEVLLVWGEKDEATPLWMGQVMEKELKNAGLAIFEGDNHYAYWNQMPRFLTVCDIFLKEDK